MKSSALLFLTLSPLTSLPPVRLMAFKMLSYLVVSLMHLAQVNARCWLSILDQRPLQKKNI